MADAAPAGERSPEEILVELRDHLIAGGTLAGFANFDSRTMSGVYALGRYFYDQNDYDTAGDIFSWLTGFDPFERQYSFALGATRQMQGRYLDAIDFLATAQALDITDPVPAFHIAECLLKLGKGQEARDMLDMAVHYAKGEQHAALLAQAKALLALLPPAPPSQPS